MPKYRLSGMKLDEVSLVRSGDNHDAKVVIAKAAQGEDLDFEGIVWDDIDPALKWSKEEANYGPASSEYGTHTCRNCVFFTKEDGANWDAPGVCDLVNGEIDGSMLSDLFIKRPDVQSDIGKVKSSAYPDLERKPGKQNWVDHAGGLPSYIERIAKHLHYEKGMSIGRAIATAVNQVKKWASGGKNVNPDTRAKAAKAVAEWEAKKVKSKAKTAARHAKDSVKKNDEEVSKKRKGVCECGVAYDSPQHAKKHKEWEAKMAKGRVYKEDPENQTDDNQPDESEEEENSTDNIGDESSDDSDNQEEEEVPDEVQKDDLPAVVRDYINALEAKVEELTKQAPKEEADPVKAAIAKADPAIRAVLEKQQQDIEEAQAIAKAEREARLEKEFLAKAENLRMISDKPSDLAGTLRKLHDLDAETATVVEKYLQTANTQIAKGNLFLELGSGGAEITISKSVEGRAEQLMKADPKLTKEQAVAMAYESDPSLYDESLKEV